MTRHDSNFGYMPEGHPVVTLRIHLPQEASDPRRVGLNFICELAATLNQGIDDPDEWCVVEMVDDASDGRHNGFNANGSGAQVLHPQREGGRLAW